MYINMVALYRNAVKGPSVLPDIVRRVRLRKGGRVIAFSQTKDANGRYQERSVETTVARLTSPAVWRAFEGADGGFVGVSKGRESLRLGKPELLWASFEGGQLFTGTSIVSTPCNMLQVLVSWRHAALRTEGPLRTFIRDSMKDLASAGDLLGAFCTIADDHDERGGGAYKSITPLPKSQLMTVMREQLILGVSEGRFEPPHHAAALCMPLKAASATCQATMKRARPFVFTIREGMQDTPFFRAGVNRGHVLCMIESEIKALLTKPFGRGSMYHARESLLMRRWLLPA